MNAARETVDDDRPLHDGRRPAPTATGHEQEEKGEPEEAASGNASGGQPINRQQRPTGGLLRSITHDS